MSFELLRACVICCLAVAPASAVGDATYSLATYRAMAAPSSSPVERFMAVYMASPERSAMLERLREKHPALIR